MIFYFLSALYDLTLYLGICNDRLSGFDRLPAPGFHRVLS